MSNTLIDNANEGDVKREFNILDVDGVAVTLSTATEITVFVKNQSGTTLNTYKYVNYTGVGDRIYADNTTQAHIWIPESIVTAYRGKQLYICGYLEAVNAELADGSGKYYFDLESFLVNKC